MTAGAGAAGLMAALYLAWSGGGAAPLGWAGPACAAAVAAGLAAAKPPERRAWASLVAAAAAMSLAAMAGAG